MSDASSVKPRWSMTRGGAYSLKTRGAKDAIDNATDLALGALARLDVENGQGPFNIADFAAADGGTSLDLIGRLVRETRARHASRPITVTYTDLPRNDFSALFSTVHGQIPDMPGYLDQVAGVHVFASATSFFDAIFPPESIDLGFSATAMHWISSIPGRISGHVHAARASGTEREQFRQRALDDWQTILLARAAELKPGGRLVMSNLCQDEQGRNLGNHRSVCMLDMFNELWHALSVRGVISDEEYARTAFPQFYKTMDEFCAPMTDESNPVYQAGLRLESAEIRIVECPYRAAFDLDGNVDAFAEAFVPTTRSWSETIFFNSLDETRPEEERARIVDQMFNDYVERVRQNPDGHAMDYAHCYQVITKT